MLVGKRKTLLDCVELELFSASGCDPTIGERLVFFVLSFSFSHCILSKGACLPLTI